MSKESVQPKLEPRGRINKSPIYPPSTNTPTTPSTSSSSVRSGMESGIQSGSSTYTSGPSSPSSPWSEYLPVPSGTIPVSVRQIVDRVQVSVRNGEGRARLVVEALKDRFVYLGMVPQRRKTVLSAIQRFRLGDCRVNVVLWTKPFFFSVIAPRPSDEVRCNLLDVLTSVPRWKGKEPWYLSQLEIALDVRPDSPQDVDLVKFHLTSGLMIPYGRGITHRQFLGTDYYASSGANVRKAPKGFRCYVKEESGPEFARLELQLNAGALDDLGLRRALMIDPAEINLFDHFQYRRCEASALARAIARRAPSRMAGAFRAGRVLSPRAWSDDERLTEPASVAQQMEHFKKLPTQYSRLVNKDQEVYFPSSHKAVQLPQDLADGFVRRMYRTRPPGAGHI